MSNSAIVSNSRNLPLEYPPVFCQLSIACLDQLLRLEASSPYPSWGKKAFEAEFGHDYSNIFGVRHGGALRGYSVLHVVSDQAHILNIVIERVCRGRGLGRFLLLETMDVAARLGGRIVSLEVRTSNIIAQNLYESLGYRIVSKREQYYRNNNEDAFVMSASLAHIVHESSSRGDEESRLVDGSG